MELSVIKMCVSRLYRDVQICDFKGKVERLGSMIMGGVQLLPAYYFNKVEFKVFLYLIHLHRYILIILKFVQFVVIFSDHSNCQNIELLIQKGGEAQG